MNNLLITFKPNYKITIKHINMSIQKFITRHNGPDKRDVEVMLKKIGVSSLDELIDQTLPDSIRLKGDLNIPEGMSEYEFQNKINKLASKNKLYKTYIGTGYYNTASPAVIWRNIFENPVWYTSYTPYQAEISQGRLEALLNFQTVVTELTGCELANASLLDEATAASEAMIMMANLRKRKAVKEGVNVVFVDKNIFPQTMEVIKAKAEPLNYIVETGDFKTFEFHDKVFGAIVQYPNNEGSVEDYAEFTKKAHENGALISVATDILSLAILTPPGEWDADIVFGSTQRLGIPMGYGGPHAAYFATKESYKRSVPGRIIGVSKDVNENRALRMALQTREQHIKREKATSNICTAQALLATMAGMYAVYHGYNGIKSIASDIHYKASALSTGLIKLGLSQENTNFFDTLKVNLNGKSNSDDVKKVALKKKINFRYFDKNTIGISIDETTSVKDLNKILSVFSIATAGKDEKITALEQKLSFDSKFERKSEFFKHELFENYRSETEMMRYIKKLERKDMSLTHSMISLGSCTMKLNSATSMMPLSNPKWGALHPFIPKNQAKGYKKLFKELANDLVEITGFEDITFQPNSGASGEYTGLMLIREYHISRGEEGRNVVLIPASAHGTNPASAVMAGMKVVVVDCDENGNIDVNDLKAKCEEYKDVLSSLMITYPSTHGVFEAGVIEMCDLIHQNGGQVYMDGANMNAQVGLTNPGRLGADVCHLNLHKTFAIPHGGGGPGVGPVAVAEHLKEFLPGNPLVKTGGENAIKAVSAAPWGSAVILPITYAYIKMLGGKGLTEATKMAILNANYLAASLKDYYKILYTGNKERVAHEMILECRNFKSEAGITEGDIAKRLMDYGFHAPTLSFPVHGTLMVEPTESESLYELDRFIKVMISIYNEIEDIKSGKVDKEDNALKNSPHSERVLTANEWNHSYSREQAGYPLKEAIENKLHIPVSRIDDAYGDRNLFCTCM